MTDVLIMKLGHRYVQRKDCVKMQGGITLLVQWLRIHLQMQGTRVSSPVRELRSHVQLSPHTATQTQHSQKKKIVHILKKNKKTQGEDSCLQAKEVSEESSPTDTLILDSGSKTVREMYFCCLPYAVCCVWLWQPKKTNTPV